MDVTHTDEGEPPDLPLVRLRTVATPALRTRPAVKNENTRSPTPKSAGERGVREPIQIGVASQPSDRGSDFRITFADVEAASRGNDSTP